ncbi:MAG: hypothetical protein IKH56_07915 [Oscillospiraceae bacterium]|nr:hypothetical protein [Oscillospiraceae bacterium]
MVQEVILKKENKTVLLETDKYYSGNENPDDQEKLVRKTLGLPTTKSLVFYSDKTRPSSMVQINKYQIVEMFNNIDRWYTIEIETIDGQREKIHSMYLAEMQKPSFIADMANQKPE